MYCDSDILIFKIFYEFTNKLADNEKQRFQQKNKHNISGEQFRTPLSPNKTGGEK